MGPMSVLRIGCGGLKAACLLVIAGLLCGFTFRPGGPPELHFKEYKTPPPRGNTVTVCHSHGCAEQETFTFSDVDIADLATLMDYVRGGNTAAGERRAIAYAIAWMERRVGPATGTANDQASLGLVTFGGQQDCVDEATNGTSYLMVLQSNGLMRHHFVIRPFSKASFLKWPHFAAMIQERGTGTIYAIDTGVGPNGANPSIQLASEWYIPDGNTPPEPEPNMINPAANWSNGGGLNALVEQVLREQAQPRTQGYAARRSR